MKRNIDIQKNTCMHPRHTQRSARTSSVHEHFDNPPTRTHTITRTHSHAIMHPLTPTQSLTRSLTHTHTHSLTYTGTLGVDVLGPPVRMCQWHQTTTLVGCLRLCLLAHHQSLPQQRSLPALSFFGCSASSCENWCMWRLIFFHHNEPSKSNCPNKHSHTRTHTQTNTDTHTLTHSHTHRHSHTLTHTHTLTHSLTHTSSHG